MIKSYHFKVNCKETDKVYDLEISYHAGWEPNTRELKASFCIANFVDRNRIDYIRPELMRLITECVEYVDNINRIELSEEICIVGGRK